jgi:GNAT superfamily N-acetyltransferase
MKDTVIRTFVGADVEPVIAIWNRALKRDPIHTGRFVSWLFGDPDYWPGDDSGFFVAVRDGRPAGFVRAIVRRWPNDRVGLELRDGWIPVMAVDPEHQQSGVGHALLKSALDYLRKAGRKRVWMCGNTGSAPGYVFPGVDKDAYPGALALLQAAGFVVDHEPVAMSGPIVDFDAETFHRQAWETGRDVQVASLTPERVQDFMDFMARAFPGDWNIAARAKVRAGALHEVLIASLGDGDILGYCQWEGEHFGPFGVAAEARNRKVGAKLFTEAVRRIRAADGRTVWFNWADEDAARFYSRFGLTVTRRFAILRKEL